VNVALSFWTALTDTPVHCLTTGERWDDVRDMQTLLEIGAWQLCNGGAIRSGSRISDEQRETFTVIATTLLVIGSRLRQR